MRPKNRQTIGRAKVQEFDLLKSTKSSLITKATPETREIPNSSKRLQALLWNEDGEQGGDDLDELLSILGDAYIEEGRVKWDPPADLDPILLSYFSRSIQELNKLIEHGAIRIDDNGDIRPA